MYNIGLYLSNDKHLLYFYYKTDSSLLNHNLLPLKFFFTRHRNSPLIVKFTLLSRGYYLSHVYLLRMAALATILAPEMVLLPLPVVNHIDFATLGPFIMTNPIPINPANFTQLKSSDMRICVNNNIDTISSNKVTI